MTDIDRLDALAAAEPTTRAGRALLRDEMASRFNAAIDDTFFWGPERDFANAILAVENEARVAAVRERDELRAAIRDAITEHVTGGTTAATALGEIESALDARRG